MYACVLRLLLLYTIDDEGDDDDDDETNALSLVWKSNEKYEAIGTKCHCQK